MLDLSQNFPTMSKEKYESIYHPILKKIVAFMGFKVDEINSNIVTRSNKLIAPASIYFPWVNLRQYYSLVALLTEEQVSSILNALTDNRVDKLTPERIFKLSPFHVCMGIAKVYDGSQKPYLEYLEDLGLTVDRRYNKIVDEF